MTISKHLHSCILVKEQGKVILIDPGEYTYTEHAFDIDNLPQLDYILITHEHPDHCYPPFIKELVAKFPNVQIISNASVVEKLAGEGITAGTEGTDFIKLENITHEKLWDKEPPENTVFTIFNKLVHPGDSHHFTSTGDILALPLQAPWGSTNDAVLKALEQKPKVILPIHDWHWKDAVRKGMYTRLQPFFKEHGIDFKALETGESIEV